jgi:hypothetical protein
MAFDKGNNRVALPPASIIPFMGISFNSQKYAKKVILPKKSDYSKDF